MNTYTPQNAKSNSNNTGIAKDSGPYLAEVMQNVDSQLSGRISVYIPDFGGDPKDSSNWLLCRYMTPFYGIQPMSNTVAGEASSKLESYGMWMQPPDVGIKVLVLFINGDRSKGVWIGCLPEIGSHGSIPANDRGDFDYYNDPNTPIADRERPQHSKAFQFAEQGLFKDPQRGPISSTSLRESPSRVFGFNTPGGNSFVMDDGNEDGGSRHIRLRSSSGNQITMNDDDGFIYIINADGTGWMELSASGHLDVFAKAGINFATNGSINMHAQADINMHAENNANIQSGNTTRLQGNQLVSLWGNNINLTSPVSLDIHCCSDIKIRSLKDVNIKASQHKLRGDKFLWNTGSVSEPDQMFKTDSVETGGYTTTTTRTPTVEPYAGHDPASLLPDESHEDMVPVQPPQGFKDDETNTRTITGTGSGGGSVTYLEGPPGQSFEDQTRNKKIQPKLMNVLRTAASQIGVDVVIFSGGQDAEGTPNARRTGSSRHDDGYAADVWIYNSSTTALSTKTNSQLVSDFISACVAAGAKGIGAGPGYMGNSGIHVDLWGTAKGSSIWGAGGKADNAPQWVKDAYSNSRNVTVVANNSTNVSGSQLKSPTNIADVKETKNSKFGGFSGFSDVVRTAHSDTGIAGSRPTFKNITNSAQKLFDVSSKVSGNVDQLDKDIVNTLGILNSDELKLIRSSISTRSLQQIGAALTLIDDVRSIQDLVQSPVLLQMATKVINGSILDNASSNILQGARDVIPNLAGTSLSAIKDIDSIGSVLNRAGVLDKIKSINVLGGVDKFLPTGKSNNLQLSETVTAGRLTNISNTGNLVAAGNLAADAISSITGFNPVSSIVPGLGAVNGPLYGCETCGTVTEKSQAGTPGTGGNTNSDNGLSNGTTTSGDNGGQPHLGSGKNIVTPANLKKDPLWAKTIEKMKKKYGSKFSEEQILNVASGESSFNTRAVNPNTNATGLFQFMPSTAKWLGTNVNTIQNMTGGEQLELYDYYLSKFNYAGGRLGIMQAAPAHADKPDNYEVYKVGSKAWQQNQVWRGRDGRITVGSINDYYDKQSG